MVKIIDFGAQAKRMILLTLSYAALFNDDLSIYTKLFYKLTEIVS